MACSDQSVAAQTALALAVRVPALHDALAVPARRAVGHQARRRGAGPTGPAFGPAAVLSRIARDARVWRGRLWLAARAGGLTVAPLVRQPEGDPVGLLREVAHLADQLAAVAGTEMLLAEASADLGRDLVLVDRRLGGGRDVDERPEPLPALELVSTAATELAGLVRVATAAEITGRPQATVRGWVHRGRLEVVDRDRAGRPLLRRRDVEEIAATAA